LVARLADKTASRVRTIFLLEKSILIPCGRKVNKKVEIREKKNEKGKVLSSDKAVGGGEFFVMTLVINYYGGLK